MSGTIRVIGYTSFGHVGCLRALSTYGLGFAGLMGVSLFTVLLPPAFVGPMIVGAVVVLLVIVVPTEYFRRHGPVLRDVEVVLDEGGVRLSIGRSRRYLDLPVARAELERDLYEKPYALKMGSTRIVLADAAKEAAEALVAELARRRAQTSSEADGEALRRSKSPLDEWGERVKRHVEGERREGGYRRADHWHDERLLELLVDRQREPEIRAAAGHALVRLAPERIDAARRACSAATPPIVVALLYAAAREPFREPFERVAPFLPRRDRRDAERLAARLK